MYAFLNGSSFGSFTLPVQGVRYLELDGLGGTGRCVARPEQPAAADPW